MSIAVSVLRRSQNLPGRPTSCWLPVGFGEMVEEPRPRTGVLLGVTYMALMQGTLFISAKSFEIFSDILWTFLQLSLWKPGS